MSDPIKMNDVTVKHRCECPEEGKATNMAWYSVDEYKAMRHLPGQCPGDYNVKLYNRNGVPMWLCSCCHLAGDLPMPINH